MTFGYRVVVKASMADVEAAVTDELKKDGFGVLTRIDMQATFKAKLDKDSAPHVILGACKPPLAFDVSHKAPEVGLLLPCNLTVREVGEGQVEVAAVEPIKMFGIIEDGGDDPQGLKPIAEEVDAVMKAVVERTGKHFA